MITRPHFSELEPQFRLTKQKQAGFALIATISVMVLLVMIALAMLSLTTIELRSARQGDAMAEARANARLALMMAVGQLQKDVGPDQRVTATGWITAENAKHRHVAGVWESWRPDPFSPPSDYDTVKDGKFVGWMVSNKDLGILEHKGFSQDGVFSDEVELLGRGTLGQSADPKDYVQAGKISVISGKRGRIAWAAMDEGVKARVDLPLEKHTGSLAMSSSNLGAASRVALEIVEKKYDSASSEPKKFISIPETELGLDTDMGARAHDLTVWSQGPMTNVIDGGLREDINLMTDGLSLPTDLADARIYSGDSEGLAPSDPYWQQVFDYASSYKRVKSVGGLPEIDASVPAGYDPVTSVGGILTANKAPAKGQVMMPVVAKVQVVFSLVSRLAHGSWPGTVKGNHGDNQRVFLLHMVYTPVVTLYNPYNVALKFDRMKLDFQNVPVGFRFYRNNQPQTNRLLPLNQLYVWYENNPNQPKVFSMTLQGKSPSGGLGGQVTLRPGEVRVFSPYMPPGYSWAADRPGDGSFYFDWRNDKTSNIQAIPGWRSEGIGFDIDWLAPTSYLTSYHETSGRPANYGVISYRYTDQVKVEYAPLAPQAAKNRFTVIASMYQGTSLKRSGAIEMDYGSTSNLQNLLPAPAGKQYIYPQPGEANVSIGSIFERDGTAISAYENVKSFCMFSAYGKTAFGGTPGHADGRYATKAWSFSNPVASVSSSDLVNEHGSHHSHELNFEPMPGHAENQVQVDNEDRGNFITGHTALHGLKFGTHNEVPIAPIQSVSNLQNANLCSSGYLPRFDYPVANSFAHPLMSSGAVREGDMLDHSFLLNHHLYDRYYCSTVSAYQGGMFGANSRSTQNVFEDFLNGDAPLLDQRFNVWKPQGKTTTQILTEVVGTSAGKDGYQKIAAYQMLRGEWNVNSLSKEAWKVVLAGMHHTDFPVYDALTNTLSTKTYVNSPMSRFRLPNGKVEPSSSGDPVVDRRNRWTGYRELDEDQLDQLAEEIIKEVRERGPFLSLSEFVNRRLSGSTDERLSGALQAAIDRTKINDVMQPDGREITSAEVADYKYKNTAAAVGHSSQGAPGSVTQGHVLNALGNAITVRSNTFTVRAYGESVDAKGNVLARAWCEAVLQRVPDYLDNSEPAEKKYGELGSQVNQKFGRRIRLVSFRWLGPGEV